jgi:RNA-directed DNA polymerase
VEPSVWTERMLTALEQGVKGGKWFSLIDKVWSPANLLASFTRVKANRGAAGVDHVTVDAFETRLEKNLRRLERALREETYRPQAVRRTYIPKPGSKEKRPLGIPTVRDRVVQGAVRHVLEPIFERDFAEHSYGFRPGLGCRDALRRVDALLREGHTWVVDADIKSYFDTIPHDRLMARVGEKVSDGRVLDLVRGFLKQGILEGLESWTPEDGTPQGAVISPLLANLYLDPFDHHMAGLGFEMIRYADDFVILCRSEADARRALDLAGQWMSENGLRLHPEKTRIVDARVLKGGFDFLGYHFQYGTRRNRHTGRRGPGWMRWPRKKSLTKFKDALRAKTPRNNGNSMEAIIRSVNSTTRGWYGYFKQSLHSVFEDLDGWVRMRLRSILRKRHKSRGHGYGRSHQRWPNAFFADLGLFSMATQHHADLDAWDQACRSPRG